MQKLRSYLPLILLSLLTGCASERITAHLDYVNRAYLASAHVDTPDPLRNNPPLGQRILITWNLAKKDFDATYSIKLTTRTCNREEKTICIKLAKNRGMYIYKLLNNCYFESGGIRAYKIELYHGSRLIDCWKHQLWAELITLNSAT